MQRAKTLFHIVVAAACAAPLAAAAQSDAVVIYVAPQDATTIERQKREALFRVLDNNTDAVISRAEAQANRQFVQAFERLDTDRSGGIDRQEFARVRLEERAAAAGASR